MNFKDLVKLTDVEIITEQPRKYIINEKGKNLLKKYRNFIGYIKIFVNDENNDALISRLDTDNIGNKLFKIAKRLSTLTNDGQIDIDSTQYTFNQNDEILGYLYEQQ